MDSATSACITTEIELSQMSVIIIPTFRAKIISPHQYL